MFSIVNKIRIADKNEIDTDGYGIISSSNRNLNVEYSIILYLIDRQALLASCYNQTETEIKCSINLVSPSEYLNMKRTRKAGKLSNCYCCSCE